MTTTPLVGLSHRSHVPATAALVAATAVWGSTFAVTKDALRSVEPASLLAWRFGIAACVLLLVGWRHVRALTGTERRRATLLGLFLALGFGLQTVGLEETLAGVSGFLMGASVVLTPLAAALVFAERIGARGWVAVALGAGGLAVLAGGVTGGTLAGGALTLVGALGSPAVWVSVIYLAVLATCVGFGVQAWAQSALTAADAAVIMTMEPVFAAVIAWLSGERGLTPVGWVGGLLVVASMMLAELGPRECCDALAPRVECC